MGKIGVAAALVLVACGGSPPARIGELCSLSEECVEEAICGQLLFRSIGGIPVACGCEIVTVSLEKRCLLPCPSSACR